MIFVAYLFKKGGDTKLWISEGLGRWGMVLRGTRSEYDQKALHEVVQFEYFEVPQKY